MPIVDGLTSAKMIRSFEKSHPSHMLSQRAAPHGRIPIIAVSASLVEKERETYIDAGFDGWILKPISFDRLKQIMLGIVDTTARSENIYKPGNWERGGWFGKAQDTAFSANTQPDADKMPMTDPSESAQNAASSSDPFVREENSSRQTQEQKRLADEQEKGREESEEKNEGEEHFTKMSQVADFAHNAPQASDERTDEETSSDAPALAASAET